MANWWDDAPLAEPSKTPAAAGNWWNAAPLAKSDSGFANPVQSSQGQTAPTRVTMDMTKSDRGVTDAVARGAAQGLTANFYDELRGLVEANGANPKDPASIYNLIGGAMKYWSGQPEASKAYDQAVSRERAETKSAEEQHPIASIAGNVAGAVALPIGAAANAATLPGRMATGAAVGAGLGGLSGVGEGSGAVDSISRGATGAALGGALGGAAPAVVEGVIRGARAAAGPLANTVRGIRNADDEAARRVASSIERDIQADPTAVSRLTPAEFVASRRSGGPATIMDVGGETTRALARSAANTSPEGRASLSRTINDRFEGQSERVTGWLRNTFNFPDADAQSKAITEVAKGFNRPAYAKAYAEGRVGIWDNELSELSQAPVVKDAVNAALKQAQNKSASGPLNGTTIERWANNGKPTLEFWDLVKRQIDQEINVAKRAGKNEDVGTLTEVKNAIVRKLDDAVPSYAKARAGAAQMFDAQDALEAGKNYVTKNVSHSDVRRALSYMTPTERQLFQDGFVSEFISSLSKIGDRRSVLNKIAESPAARERLNIALGKEKTAELEAGLRVEGIMDFARNAVQGNSTTARQLAELGLAGGAYGFSGGGLNPFSDPGAVMNAALAYGALKGKNRINENVSRRVAEMLTSSDPAKLLQGIRVVTRNQNLFNSLRAADRGLARVGGEQASGIPAITAIGAGRAEDKPETQRPPGQR